MKSRAVASKTAKEEQQNVRMRFDGYLIWILSPDRPDYRITGKYLFFSIDQDKLLQIAKNEILNHGFHRAKVNSKLIGKNTEYVLCLKDDSRKYELAERHKKEYPDVKYRYWKSDEATLKGKYSKEFLEKLGEEERQYFTSQKEFVEFRNKKGR